MMYKALRLKWTHSGRVGKVASVSEPGAEVVVGWPPGYVVHHQSTSSTSVVRPEIQQDINTNSIDMDDSVRWNNLDDTSTGNTWLRFTEKHN
jgi:hypothetical protein